jgi:hypothetical protein
VVNNCLQISPRGTAVVSAWRRRGGGSSLAALRWRGRWQRGSSGVGSATGDSGGGGGGSLAAAQQQRKLGSVVAAAAATVAQRWQCGSAKVVAAAWWR